MVTRPRPIGRYSLALQTPVTRSMCVSATFVVPGLLSPSAVLTGSAFDAGRAEDGGTASGNQSTVSAHVPEVRCAWPAGARRPSDSIHGGSGYIECGWAATG